VGAATKVEHFEIATYRGLVMAARKLEAEEAARLLEENLKQEEQTLERLQKLMEQL